MFLNSFNYFRAIAIIFVVFAHSHSINPNISWQIDSNIDAFLFNFMMNGTVFFVFISGFLFEYVFVKNYVYPKFLHKKLKVVVLPYLFLSILPIIFWQITDLQSSPHLLYLNSANSFETTFWYILTGRHLTAFWYIPMVVLLFLITPFLVYLHKKNYLLHLALPLFVVALFIHRPVANINIYQSLLYFLPVFLIGMFCSKNKDFLYQKLNKKEWIFLVLALLFLILQTLTTNQIGNSHKEAFEFAGIDFSLLQKLSLCFFLMIFLHRFETKNFLALDLLAKMSFAIYFIHPFFTTYLRSYPLDLKLKGNFFTSLIFCILLILTSMFIAYVCKTILKHKSKYFIGW